MSYDLSRTLFSINTDSFTCKEFLDALEHYGILNSWKERVREGKALVRKAESENLKIDLDELAEMTNEFRYSEKLLSSDEFNEFLQSINLEVSDFEEYLKRAYWTSQLDVDGDVDGEVLDSEIFAEIYFSRAYRGLMDSCLSRLLTWYDKNEVKSQNFEELEAHFKSYKKNSEQYFDEKAWLQSVADSSEEVDLEELREQFFDEVLKTLKVKYVS